MGQLKTQERRLQKDDWLQKPYQETRDTDVKAGYVELIELNKARDNIQCYVPHHPVISPHKHEKITKVCNAAGKYQSVALIDKLCLDETCSRV